jgi:hypothetical protein
MAPLQIISSEAEALLVHEALYHIVASATLDADRVAAFLRLIGLKASPQQPIALPRSFLLHLGAAFRLLAWEERGFHFHGGAGLPAAEQVFGDTFSSLSDPGADPTELCGAILSLNIQRFAWHGPRDLAADVVLDELTDDAALDAVAEFLWANRHIGSVAECPQP